MEFMLFKRALFNTSTGLPSSARTLKYSVAPENWATLAQVACRTRSVSDGTGKFSLSGVVNVTSGAGNR